MNEISTLTDAADSLWALVVANAIMVLGFVAGRKMLRMVTSESGGSSDARADAEERRWVEVENGIHGQNPGFGAFHGDKGAGLHGRSRR